MDRQVSLLPQWQHGILDVKGAKTYLLLEFKATSQSTTERAKVNVGLVLDRSGSMSGSKIDYSRRACQFVVDQMSAQDILSMVAFDDEVTTVFEPAQVQYKDVLKQKIAQIHHRGMTNLSGGLIQGIQHVLSKKEEGMINRTILLSDGQANQGITDREKLAQIAQKYHEMGIAITTIGVGEGFDEDLMEGISEAGGGNFYFVDQPDKIPTIFTKELEGVLSVVGQNLQLTIKSSPLVTIKEAHGYRYEKKGEMITLSLGDIYGGENKSILLELEVLPHGKGAHDLLELTWSYLDVVDTLEQQHMNTTLSTTFSDVVEEIEKSCNSYVEQQVEFTRSAHVLQEAIGMWDRGDREQARGMLRERAMAMREFAETYEDSTMDWMEQSVKIEELAEEDDVILRKAMHAESYRTRKRREE